MPFLYVLGYSHKQEFIWTYKLNASGVPVGGPIQALSVKPALIQFYLHPNGKFAYAMYQWQAFDPNTNQYGSVGDITLFTVDAKTGLLTNTKRAMANFPIQENWSPSIQGMNTKGTELYAQYLPWDSMLYSIYYMHSTINPTTGSLSSLAFFWQDDYPSGKGVTGFGDLFMAQSTGLTSSPEAINVYPNAVYPKVLIHCDINMLRVCSDETYGMVFDPTGKYLLFRDSTIGEVPILYVSAPKSKLIASGASIPGYPTLVKFSPSGILLYAVDSSNILVYVFNSHTGLLTAKTSMPNNDGVAQLLPVK
jgi:hypothetical protein